MYEPEPYILLIDDDEDDLEMLSSALEKKGIKVKTFDSSVKAVFYLSLMSGNRELPSFIIMDYNMPRKNGYEVLLLLKNNIDTAQIPVVIYSTGINNILKISLSEAGALNCFSKPWSHQEFTSQVEIFQSLSYSFLVDKNLA
jgi:response regulator RpfG family c-di-GMP phosphodiesterase